MRRGAVLQATTLEATVLLLFVCMKYKLYNILRTISPTSYWKPHPVGFG